MPFHVVDDTGSLFALVAPELWGVGEMHLAGFAAIEVAPGEAWSSFLFRSVVEFDIARGSVSGLRGAR
jgi:NO-binding membrane sensor protein with MHYT domain